MFNGKRATSGMGNLGGVTYVSVPHLRMAEWAYTSLMEMSSQGRLGYLKHGV